MARDSGFGGVEAGEAFLDNPSGYRHANALLLARCALLAYREAAEIAAVARGWGFECDPARDFIEDAGVGTQLFLARRGACVILAFRGSEARLDDWATDLNALPVDGPGGQVHQGFHDALAVVWERLLARLREHRPEHLWITGHSLGGALATMAAARLALGDDPRGESGLPEAALIRGVYTFGSPRIGDAQYAAAFEGGPGQRTWRYVNNNDVVTRVPPPTMGYRHVGRLLYFDSDGVLEERDSPTELMGDRLAGQIKALRAHRADAVADHGMGDYLRHLEANPAFRPSSVGSLTARQVLLAEARCIAEARARVGESGIAGHYVGLALSGGGIRSATFNLGLIQSLAGCGLLRRVDYLSTVSGGGYVGSWLSAWVSREKGGIAQVERRLAGGTRAGGGFDDAGEAPEVTWLRRFSNYLTPRTGFLGADTMAGVATWLRNTLLNQLLLFALFALLAGLAWLSLALMPGVRGEGLRVLVLPLAFLLAGMWGAHRETQSLEHGGQGSFGGSRNAVDLACLGVMSLTFAGVLALRPDLAASPHARMNLLVWPMPLAVLLLFGVSVLGQGLVGRGAGEATREWWARAGGRWLTLALAYWVLAAMVFYTPFLTLVARDWVTTLGGLAWLATTVAGAATATGAGTRAGGAGWGEKLARVAPYVFIAGALILVAVGVHKAVDALAWGIDGRPRPGVEQRGGGTAFVTVYRDICPADPLDQPGWQLTQRQRALPDGATGIETRENPAHCRYLRYAERAEQALVVAGPERVGGVLLALALFILLLSWRVDINVFSFHFFYRNRLEQCFLGASRQGERQPGRYTGLDPRDSPHLPDLAEVRPYHLVSTALNASHDPVEGATDRLGWQERKSASFLFSPLYCGYRLAFGTRGVNAYQPSADFAAGTVPPGPSLGMAMTISGAAANPNWGYHTHPATAFLMTLFNLRLGWWMQNPRSPRRWRAAGPAFSGRLLVAELMGSTTDRSDYVNLSDGGHFENLGLYELVRRRCRVIIASDAGQDARFTFEDLGNAIRKCRADFGADIVIDPRAIIAGADGISAHHCAVGLIRYPETEDEAAATGYLLYLKASLTGNEPADILQYKAQNADFPHQSTLDQWFDESQFESYRKLGEHIGRTVLCEEYRQLELRAGPDKVDLVDLLDRLWRRWCRPSPHVAGAFTRHGEALDTLFRELRQTPALDQLDAQLASDWDPVAEPDSYQPDARPSREVLYFCASLFQLMENVYLDLQLESDHAHPDNQGWMNLFRQWARAPAVRLAWAVFGCTYGQRFRDFCEQHLHFQSPRLGLTVHEDLAYAALGTGMPRWLGGRGGDWFADRMAEYGPDHAERRFDVVDLRLLVDTRAEGPVMLEFGYAVVARASAGHRPRLVDFSLRPHLRGLGLGRRAAMELVDHYRTQGPLVHRPGLGGGTPGGQALRDTLHAGGILPA